MKIQTIVLPFLIGIFLCFSLNLYAQKSGVRGQVFDMETSEPISGVSIKVIGESAGTLTNQMGEFVIPLTSAGEYKLQVSYVGYKSDSLNIELVEDSQWLTRDFYLVNESSLLEEIVITRHRDRTAEIALLKERRESNLMLNQIGIRELNQKGVSDVENAVSKVVGITKSDDGSQVFVRGMGDRYNSTFFNGLPLPSNDPGLKNLSLDLLSTDLVEYVEVDKAFNSYMYGDFAGGNINVKSKEYSGKGVFELSLSSTVNSNTIAHADQFSFYPGEFDKLGFANYKIPNNPLSNFNFVNSANPVARNPYPGGAKLLAGKSYQVGHFWRANFLATAGFSNGYDYQEGFNKNINAQGADLLSLNQVKYSYSTHSQALLNANLAYQDKHKLSYNFMFINTSEQTNDLYTGFIRDIAENDNGRLQRGAYSNNRLFVNQVLGTHKMSDDLNLNWSGSINNIFYAMPDRIQNTFRFMEDQQGYVFAQDAITDNHRFNQKLNEREYAFDVHAKYNLPFLNTDDNDNFFRVGYQAKMKRRDFEAIQFNFRIAGDQLYNVVDPSNLDAFFNQENFQENYFFIESFADETPQSYQGIQDVHATYFDLTYQWTPKLTSIIGMRYENLKQEVSWITQLDPAGGINQLSKNKFLPSLNLKYLINNKQNLRLGASKTYTLPQFKERAPFVYDEPTERTFGNPYLYPSDNYNIDLKWEMFPQANELIALGVFGKYIQNPINAMTVASTSNDISYVNVGDNGTVMGVELEFKKQLISWDSEKHKLHIGGNATLMKTHQVIDEEKVARETEFYIMPTHTESSFTGASDLLVNADISYELNLGNGKFVNSSVVYHYFSDRLYSLGIEQKGNFVDKAVGSLDFVLQSKLTSKVGLRLLARNLLDPSYQRVQENSGAHVPVMSYKKGRFFTLGVTYSL